MGFAMQTVLSAVLAAWAFFAAAAQAAEVVEAVEPAAKAVAKLFNAEGQMLGKANFEQTPRGVLILVEVAGLPPGSHGIHLHGAGSCAPDFKAAKGHINPQGVEHGLRNPSGPDEGDLPNLHVAADGTATAEFYNARISLADDGDKPALLDADGSAVIIHDQPDDHRTQPIGGAGGRIGCGVIKAVATTQEATPQ